METNRAISNPIAMIDYLSDQLIINLNQLDNYQFDYYKNEISIIFNHQNRQTTLCLVIDDSSYRYQIVFNKNQCIIDLGFLDLNDSDWKLKLEQLFTITL